MNIGIIGDGQLGSMTIFENRKLNFNFFVLGKNPTAPASRIADRFFGYDEYQEFFNIVDRVVVEFEHIPDIIFENLKNYPNFRALELKRSRIKEKLFLRERGYPLGNFDFSYGYQLEEKIKKFSLPVVVKAEKLGYDGKGQYLVKDILEITDILKNHSLEEGFVIEEFIDFKYEISTIGVRDKNSDKNIYPISFNYHEGGILLYNYAPFLQNKDVEEIVLSLLDDLEIEGLLAVEFFLTKDDEILINEFAPRPHNTGHYTMEASYTSQFENLIRAVVGLPIGSTQTKIPTGMVNILGKSLEDFDTKEILKVEGTQLYWYGKEKKPRRKMGHINIVDKDIGSLKEKIRFVLKNIYSKIPSKV
ncbi:MAG: 5-(carboxyamino)imidazole ribonucleotide synthase [Aquificae bacterium]|nr:5-(carboxyamino)imidazole ribonucleotide synthase [Aquificota bacterium]